MQKKYFGEIVYVNNKDMYAFIKPDSDYGLTKDVYYKLNETDNLKKFYQVSFYIETKDDKTYAYDVKAGACYCNDLYCVGLKTCGTKS